MPNYGDRDNQEYQDAINLTPKQEKAWKKFEAAVRELKKEHVYLHQVLSTVGGLNGNNVERVTDVSEIDDPHNHPGCLHWLDFPYIDVTDAWADDTHVVILKKK
jgi:hypothetical protein